MKVVDNSEIYKIVTQNKDFTDLAKKVFAAERQNKKYTRTNKEFFLSEIFGLLNQIQYKINDLNKCEVFIRSYPSIKLWKKMFSRREYITYHLEIYYINIAAIFDRLLKLVNFLFNLGLADRQVSYDIVDKNSRVDKKTKKLLKFFFNSTENVRKIQNNIKHKERYSEKDLDDCGYWEELTLQDFFIKISEKSLVADIKFINKNDYKRYLKKKRKEIGDNNKNIHKFIEIFLKDHLELYKKLSRKHKIVYE